MADVCFGGWRSALQLPGGQTLDTCAQQTVPSEKDLAKLPLSHSPWNVVFQTVLLLPCGTEPVSECILGIVSGLESLWLYCSSSTNSKLVKIETYFSSSLLVYFLDFYPIFLNVAVLIYPWFMWFIPF